MPETSPEVHHPATVGSTFMRQYYHLLAKEPGSLHRFYKDESTWCHGVGSHMQDAISGQQAINDEILRRGYAGARVDLDIGSIDCQSSLNGGVLVLVTGVMTLTSSPIPKPFVQTFFLAVQPKGYFVLNDCLRFLELPGGPVAPSVADVAVAPTTEAKTKQAAIGTPVAASPAPKSKPVTPIVKKEKAPASPVAKAVEKPVSPVKIASPVKVASPKAAPASASAPAPVPTPAPASPVKKAAPTEVKTTPKPSETKPATPTATPAKTAAAPESPAAAKPTPAAPVKPAEPVAPAAPPAPKTWAALFSASPAAPVAAPKAAPAAPKPAPASPAKATADAAAKPTDATAAHEPAKEKKRLYSLYIRDVPPQTKEADLRELFKSYGPIASVGVPANRGIAFVDYRDEESMRAALADDKEFKLHDKVIHVEERKDKERGGFRADARSGRGGRGAPKSGRSGERKEREDGKERRADAGHANGKAPTSNNGPRANSGDRREKAGRRSGKEDGGRGNKE